MTREEYEEFKIKEEQLNKQRGRVRKFEELNNILNSVNSNINDLKRLIYFGSVETTGDYVHVHITDKEFCREKLLEIFNREKELLEQQIKEL